MQRRAKLRIWYLLKPLIQAIEFFFKAIYAVLFGWWLDPWYQRKSNRALLNDVQANFFFLTSKDQVRITHPKGILPFDYASVEIRWENLVITITRGRGDTAVIVAPRSAPRSSYELGPLIAGMERRHFSKRDVVYDLAGAATLLKSHLEVLNNAFSEAEFHERRSCSS